MIPFAVFRRPAVCFENSMQPYSVFSMFVDRFLSSLMYLALMRFV